MTRQQDTLSTAPFLISSAEDVDHTTRMVRNVARTFGFDALDANLIAAATSELTMNAVLHAGHGITTINETANGLGLEITIIDEGPGIADLDMAQEKGFSSRPDGLGLGLTAAAQAVEEFEIASTPGEGTSVALRHYLEPPTDLFDTGVAASADAAYSCSGDVAFTTALQGDKQMIALIDGMGQGELAKATADCARKALEGIATKDLCERASHAHETVKALGLERGFAMALLLATQHTLRLVTVGDVACRVFNANEGTEPYHFAERPGTLGTDMPVRFVEQVVDLTDTEGPVVVVLATDGVSTRFSTSGDPIAGSSLEIAHAILSSFRRQHGDATVMVLRIGR